MDIQIDRVTVEVFPYASITFNGTTTTQLSTSYSAGEDIEAFRLVILDSGLLYKADPNNPSHGAKVIGIAIESGVNGASIRVVTDGIVTNSTWNWDLSNGHHLFASDDGNITNIASFNTAWFLEVGRIINNDRIYIDLQDLLVL
jgi:hypothetical protein